MPNATAPPTAAIDGSRKVRLADWFFRNQVLLMRISLAIVFVWFGGLKLFPGMSPAEGLAGKTLSLLTLHLVSVDILVRALGVMEVGIGLGFLTQRSLRPTLWVYFVHMAGTFTPLILLPGDSFACAPYCLSLIGQYIVKNLVFICAGIMIARGIRTR